MLGIIIDFGAKDYYDIRTSFAAPRAEKPCEFSRNKPTRTHTHSGTLVHL